MGMRLAEFVPDAENHRLIGLFTSRRRLCVEPEIVLDIKKEILVDRDTESLVGIEPEGIAGIDVPKSFVPMEYLHPIRPQVMLPTQAPAARRRLRVRAIGDMFAHMGDTGR